MMLSKIVISLIALLIGSHFGRIITIKSINVMNEQYPVSTLR